MVVNFRACGINRGVRKLTRTLTLKKKKHKGNQYFKKKIKTKEVEIISEATRGSQIIE
jgi:hypothetical protein